MNKPLIRIGIGYDVHQLSPDRKLILGGVEIPHSLGLLGHSDADVLIHAIIDSLLGALALGDIGKLFPDTDKKYKNISSTILLKEVGKKIKESNYSISNIDSIIIAQRPKLSTYIESMREKLSNILEIDISQLSIKATTEEKLGFTGREEGIAAQAICSLQFNSEEN